MIPEIGVMIQQNVRKKKRAVLMLMREESETSLSNVW